MSGMSLSKLADLTLDTIDPYKRGEGKFTKQWVEEQLLVQRNHFRKIDVERSIDGQEEIDEDWFTDRDGEILRDAKREVFYAEIANGHVSLPDDMGIRVLPYAGVLNPFIRIPQGWASLRPDLAHAEGNIVWEAVRGRIEFPLLRPGQIPSGAIVLRVIENGPPSDPEADIPMPDRFYKPCMDEVLRLMGYSPNEDRKTDTKPGDSE